MTDIVVVVKLVPDLVEELEIDASGTKLDKTWLRHIINESDDHALEQAILLIEKGGGNLTVLAPDTEGVDEVLYTALAKGANRVIKLSSLPEDANNHALARALCPLVRELQPDLVLTGVQAHNDLDGSLGSLLSGQMDLPYTGYISAVELTNGTVAVRKEYPGGLIAEMVLRLPAILGIQSAETPPRYVAVSKVRQTMQSASIEVHESHRLDPSGGLAVSKLSLPEVADRATMIPGTEREIAARLVEIFREAGVI